MPLELPSEGLPWSNPPSYTQGFCDSYPVVLIFSTKIERIFVLMVHREVFTYVYIFHYQYKVAYEAFTRFIGRLPNFWSRFLEVKVLNETFILK